MRRFFVTLALIAIALAPFGARANDRQIAEQIVRSLKQRKAAGELQGFNIDLQVDKGAVWLKGYVSEPEQERIALDIARRVEGVEKVFNQIELRSAPLHCCTRKRLLQLALKTIQCHVRKHRGDDAALRRAAVGLSVLPIFQVACLQQSSDEVDKASVLDVCLDVA